VQVEEGGTFTMRSGTISGNTNAGTYGGGVYANNNGAFDMTGGTITGNTSNYGGGGVYIDNYGTFTMSGSADISGNTIDNGNGGGVYVWGEGTFTMEGGTISGNTANKESPDVSGNGGGGVYVRNGTFTMTGGTISSNTASFYGGGVSVFSHGDTGATFIKTGGTIYGDKNNDPNNGYNTATDNKGHAVFYADHIGGGNYYCNDTLEEDESGNISTEGELPGSGQTLGNWTR
jgi:hypothetical protein